MGRDGSFYVYVSYMVGLGHVCVLSRVRESCLWLCIVHGRPGPGAGPRLSRVRETCLWFRCGRRDNLVYPTPDGPDTIPLIPFDLTRTIHYCSSQTGFNRADG